MGKTCPVLFNFDDTNCLLMPHLIRQLDPVALKILFHIIWVFRLPLTLLGSNTWNSSLNDDMVLFNFLYLRDVFILANVTTKQIFLFFPSVRVRLRKSLAMRYLLSEISCSSSLYQLPVTALSLYSTTLYTRRLVALLVGTDLLTVKCSLVQFGM